VTVATRDAGAVSRCGWCEKSDLYRAYHDTEWGVPLHDDRRHFEFILLDGAQAGLSWETILKKREAYREAFDGFDPERVARYPAARIAKLLRTPGIVRNRLKVAGAVQNGRVFLAVQEQFGGFDGYIWGFVGGQPKQNRWRKLGQVPASTTQSEAMSADLRKRGFTFVGPTICYAYMQAAGMVNDHLTSCFRCGQVAGLR
jgi:DNA-3-methyladenine glycosylase I